MFIILACILFACKKEHADTINYKEMLIGNWTGQTWRYLVTRYDGTTPITVEDSTFYGYENPFYFDVKVDTFALAFYRGTTLQLYLTAAGNGAYIVSENKLTFSQNPYSLNPGFPAFDMRTCTIKEISSNKLVLYDTDTANFSPLIVAQLWHNFAR
jgi:hypothetical protein